MEYTPDPRDPAAHGKPKATKMQRDDRKVSKSKTIRLMAREMVSRGQPPRPKDIVAELGKQGIVVGSSQVSMALRETEFAFRQLRVDWVHPPVMFPDPLLAFRLVGIDDVQKAKAFVENLGSFEKAMAALVVLRQFGGGDISVVSPTPTPPSIPTPTPVPPRNKTMEAEMEALEQHRSGS